MIQKSKLLGDKRLQPGAAGAGLAGCKPVESKLAHMQAGQCDSDGNSGGAGKTRDGHARIMGRGNEGKPRVGHDGHTSIGHHNNGGGARVMN